MPTVMPCVKARRSPLFAPARSSTSVIAATTPRDWSPAVVGTFAVCRRSPASSAASVNVPPTSTPSSIGRNYREAGGPPASLFVAYAAAATSSVASSSSSRCLWDGQ